MAPPPRVVAWRAYKICSIRPSHLLPDDSTTLTRPSLTSLFEWEAVTLGDVAAYEGEGRHRFTYMTVRDFCISPPPHCYEPHGTVRDAHEKNTLRGGGITCHLWTLPPIERLEAAEGTRGAVCTGPGAQAH